MEWINRSNKKINWIKFLGIEKQIRGIDDVRLYGNLWRTWLYILNVFDVDKLHFSIAGVAYLLHIPGG